MQGGGVPTVEGISAATDQEVLGLYADVMSELMARGREEHREYLGPEEGLLGPLVAVDDEALLQLYRAVHDEMLAREAERPGLWEPSDDEGPL